MIEYNYPVVTAPTSNHPRQVFATSSFMQRCQEWRRGYAGDFETIEYMVSGANESLPGTLGWHIEKILLESPAVQHPPDLSRSWNSTFVDLVEAGGYEIDSHDTRRAVKD